MSISAPYFKIETFGAVDGPGVRLVIFLQGCPYRCLYCHNPESWPIKNTPTMTTDALLSIYEKNQSFYKNGGITLSGGEPLLHLDFCIELAKKCKAQKINLALDTSGCTFTKNHLMKFKQLIKYQPLWIVDIKQMNPSKHQAITGVKHQYELDLIKFLETQHQKYWIRQVIVPGLTNNSNDLKLLSQFIKQLSYMVRFELLPYHRLAIAKYRDLAIQYKLNKVKEPTQLELTKAKRIMEQQ